MKKTTALPSSQSDGRRETVRRRIFPRASRPATMAVLLFALLADEQQGFGREEELKRKGIPDRAYARGVLTFLDLLERTRPGKLKRDFLLARQEASREGSLVKVKAFLQQRLARGCRAVLRQDLPADAVLGYGELSNNELDDAVDALLAALPAEDGNGDGNRYKMAACLKALHEALLPGHDLAWIAGQVGRNWLHGLEERLQVTLDERGLPSSWRKETTPGATGSNGPSTRSTPGTATQLTARPNGEHSDARNELAQPFGPVKTCRDVFAEPIRVALANDRVVRAQVTFWSEERPGESDWLAEFGPEHAGWLENLAMRLLEQSDSLRNGRR